MSEQKRRAVALGYFDGLHIGHRQVLAAALEQKQNGLTPCVLLFDKSPAAVLTGTPVPRLMTEEDRQKTLADMGFEIVTLSFSELVNLSAADFFTAVLCKDLSAAFLSCGYNYSFGQGGKGNVSLLREYCAQRAVALSVCSPVTLENEPVSSTAIRLALQAGELQKANRMLGAPFGFCAPVFRGDARGRLLDAPTANQYLPEGLTTPKYGVYATRVTLPDGRIKRGVTDIGCRPTFAGSGVRSETYILDYTGDLYAQSLRIELLSFLREERTFPSMDALKAQIRLDAARAAAAEE